MYNQTKAPAVWVHTFNIGDGTRVSISDKGAFKFTQILPSGEERFMLCMQPKHVEALVNASGDLGNILLSPEYKAIIDGKGAAKERSKLTLQIEREKAKLAQMILANTEALTRLTEAQGKIKAG